MSLLLDSDVTTHSGSVTLLLGLQQLTSIPPDVGNRANDISGSSSQSVVLSLNNETQTATVSYLTTSVSQSTSSATGGSGGSFCTGNPKKGLLITAMMIASLSAGILI